MWLPGMDEQVRPGRRKTSKLDRLSVSTSDRTSRATSFGRTMVVASLGMRLSLRTRSTPWAPASGRAATDFRAAAAPPSGSSGGGDYRAGVAAGSGMGGGSGAAVSTALAVRSRTGEGVGCSGAAQPGSFGKGYGPCRSAAEPNSIMSPVSPSEARRRGLRGWVSIR